MSIIRDAIAAHSDTEVYNQEEIDQGWELLRKKKVTGPDAERLRQSLRNAIMEGRVKAPDPLTWGQFKSENPKALTLKRHWFHWMSQKDSKKISEIRRLYGIVPSLWESLDEPADLAIIAYRDADGRVAHTTPPPTRQGCSTGKVVRWLDKSISTLDDYSSEQQSQIIRHRRLATEMRDYLDQVIYPRFPLKYDSDRREWTKGI